MELKGRKYDPVPCTRDSAHMTFGPSDLTSMDSMCTGRVFGGTGIEPRPSGLESDTLTTGLPTALTILMGTNCHILPRGRYLRSDDAKLY
ncbi:hypothetical protein TNCV_4156711 [Trichonephila clavipes]|nr:hypothetical protein TNCV_4156711 [Trichonephila clavipes]